MRPESEIYGQELYECFECGVRSETGGICECGGDLQHLGRRETCEGGGPSLVVDDAFVLIVLVAVFRRRVVVR